MNTEDDWKKEMAIDQLHDEEVMKKATKEQCIYLFVEGESEESTFNRLLSRTGLSLDEQGIVIANYSGIGNMDHSLRLLKKTLSHDRPVVVTYDNDEIGYKTVSKHDHDKLKKENVFFFPIPNKPVVFYKNGHKGGSFEEMFEHDLFLECCFSLTTNEEVLRNEFIKIFDVSKPWFDQIKKYFASIEDHSFYQKKTQIAQFMVNKVTKIPKTIIELSDFLKEVRSDYPVINPNFVELPKIRGLTC